jgi:phosphatidylglycerophosphate synthase
MSERSALTLDRVRQLGQGDAHLDADPTYARLVMRRISPAITYLVVRYTGLSADAVTALAIACGIAGGLLAALGTLATNLAAVALLQLAYLLDVADGEVARVRRTAGKRGTYLDLIGHVVQNRALYGGATFSLVLISGYAWWAIVIAMLGVAFASAFGEQSRAQVLGGGATSSPHGARSAADDPMPPSPSARTYWLYRQARFAWNYPASMNLFCIALLVDAVRFAVDSTATALVLPAFAGAFAVTLAAKQMVNALRLLRRNLWTAP